MVGMRVDGYRKMVKEDMDELCEKEYEQKEQGEHGFDG